MKENQASSTAFSVSQGLIYTSRRDDIGHIVPKDLADATTQIMESNPEGIKRLNLLDSVVFKATAPLAERLVVPGLSIHYVMRKRYISDAVEEAIAAGATQVINLGAGFDALGLRLHERYPDVTFIELDHPATCREKRASFDQIGRRYGKDLSGIHLMPIDFTHQTLADSLRTFEPFDSEAMSAFVCEGVLMYLDEAAVVKLFADVKAVSAPGSRLIFTALHERGSEEHTSSLLLRAYLKVKGEALHWYTDSSAIGGFVEAQGYTLLDVGTAPVFKERYLAEVASAITMHTIEYAAVAEVA